MALEVVVDRFAGRVAALGDEAEPVLPEGRRAVHRAVIAGTGLAGKLAGGGVAQEGPPQPEAEALRVGRVANELRQGPALLELARAAGCRAGPALDRLDHAPQPAPAPDDRVAVHDEVVVAAGALEADVEGRVHGPDPVVRRGLAPFHERYPVHGAQPVE